MTNSDFRFLLIFHDKNYPVANHYRLPFFTFADALLYAREYDDLFGDWVIFSVDHRAVLVAKVVS
jgi:hypothetical protein